MEQVLTLRTNTKTYTEKDILDEIKECAHILAEMGYTECLTNKYTAGIDRATTRYGCCHIKRNTPHTFHITISKYALASCEPEKIHNTIMHETIHSINGGNSHTGEWLKAATKLNNLCKNGAYKFMPIKRLGNDEGFKQVRNENAKYIVTCAKCGYTWGFQRYSRTVSCCKNGTATCACGGRNFTVITR